MDVGQHYLEDALNEFRRLKKSADKAMAQVSDAEFFRAHRETHRGEPALTLGKVLDHRRGEAGAEARLRV